MLVFMDKKENSRKIIALTPILTSDPNFSSVSFRPNFIPSFLNSIFVIRMGFEITDTKKDQILIKFKDKQTSTRCLKDYNLPVAFIGYPDLISDFTITFCILSHNKTNKQR